jgi:endonuclease/exonuclease/phosphatase family metal-dependent hydrolase
MSNKRCRVGTFNLYNMVLPGHKYYGGRVYTQEQYEQKLQWVGEQLRRMDGDIVGFQEVFHPQALQDALDKSGRYESATVIAGRADGQQPVVGLVSRLPVLETEFIAGFPQDARLEINDTVVPCGCFSRPILYAKIGIRESLEVMVLVVHLKSKNPLIREEADPHDPVERAIGKARSLIVRTTEATALRCILLDRLQGNDNPLIVVGDTNDIGTAVTSEIITGSPPWRNIPYERKLRVWDVLLYNVKDIQARQSYRDAYYTHIHNGHYESLDHILVSQEFVRQNPKRLGQVEYVSIFNDHLIDETLSDDKVPVWQSDHGQVVATIRLR